MFDVNHDDQRTLDRVADGDESILSNRVPRVWDRASQRVPEHRRPSSNDTPCFARFRAAFSGSHSNCLIDHTALATGVATVFDGADGRPACRGAAAGFSPARSEQLQDHRTTEKRTEKVLYYQAPTRPAQPPRFQCVAADRLRVAHPRRHIFCDQALYYQQFARHLDRHLLIQVRSRRRRQKHPHSWAGFSTAESAVHAENSSALSADSAVRICPLIRLSKNGVGVPAPPRCPVSRYLSSLV